MKSAFLLILLYASLSFLILIPTFILPASGQYSISLRTDNTKYVVGTPIRAFVQAFDASTGTLNEQIPVILTLTQVSQAYRYPFLELHITSTPRNVSTVSTLVGNGTTSVLIASPTSPGDYELTASVPKSSFLMNKIKPPPILDVATLRIVIQDLLATRAFEILAVGWGIGFVGLAIVIVKAPRSTRGSTPPTGDEDHLRYRRTYDALHSPLNYRTYSLLRFVFLSIIAGTLMIAFALTDVQITPVSPLGLIIKSGNGSSPLTDNQWVINFGGIATNDYSTGVQVPVSVVIFGVAGGYLRFLYYTATKERESESRPNPLASPASGLGAITQPTESPPKPPKKVTRTFF